jgi:hypothetical protein
LPARQIACADQDSALASQHSAAAFQFLIRCRTAFFLPMPSDKGILPMKRPPH